VSFWCLLAFHSDACLIWLSCQNMAIFSSQVFVVVVVTVTLFFRRMVCVIWLQMWKLHL
jgi:hypothetical protein